MAKDRKRLHEVLGLKPGNITVSRITVDEWGSEVAFDCRYQYPPLEQHFRIIFGDCRSVEWFVQRDSAALHGAQHAQLLSHDLGAGDYRRTARMATTLAEVIISYGRLKIERDDER